MLLLLCVQIALKASAFCVDVRTPGVVSISFTGRLPFFTANGGIVLLQNYKKNVGFREDPNFIALLYHSDSNSL